MHSLVIFRGSERGCLLPLLHSVIFKTVTMQPDCRWFEKNAIFGLLPLFGLLKLGSPSFSSAMERGVLPEGALGLPPALPSSCKTCSLCDLLCHIFIFPGPWTGVWSPGQFSNPSAPCWVKLRRAGTGLKHFSILSVLCGSLRVALQEGWVLRLIVFLPGDYLDLSWSAKGYSVTRSTVPTVTSKQTLICAASFKEVMISLKYSRVQALESVT